GLHFGGGEIVERPHALVGMGEIRRDACDSEIYAPNEPMHAAPRRHRRHRSSSGFLPAGGLKALSIAAKSALSSLTSSAAAFSRKCASLVAFGITMTLSLRKSQANATVKRDTPCFLPISESAPEEGRLPCSTGL